MPLYCPRAALKGYRNRWQWYDLVQFQLATSLLIPSTTAQYRVLVFSICSHEDNFFVRGSFFCDRLAKSNLFHYRMHALATFIPLLVSLVPVIVAQAPGDETAECISSVDQPPDNRRVLMESRYYADLLPGTGGSPVWTALDKDNDGKTVRVVMFCSSITTYFFSYCPHIVGHKHRWKVPESSGSMY